jgi:hypothetical protein
MTIHDIGDRITVIVNIADIAEPVSVRVDAVFVRSKYAAVTILTAVFVDICAGIGVAIVGVGSRIRATSVSDVSVA